MIAQVPPLIKGIATLVLALGAACATTSGSRSIGSIPKKWSQEIIISGGGVTAIACTEPWPWIKDRLQYYNYEEEREAAIFDARLMLQPYTRYPITGTNPYARLLEKKERLYWEERNMLYTPTYRGEYAYAYPFEYQDNADGTSCVKVYLPN